jgi:hypothetical protein
MTLAAKLSFQFEKRIQFKGQGLFIGNAVKFDETSPNRLHGSVRGGQNYQIKLAYVQGSLHVSCGCPYFGEYGPCKHLWAAVLEADRQGALRDAATNGAPLKLSYGDVHPSMRSPLLVPPRPKVAAPQPPPWQEYLAAVQQGLAERRPEAAHWPAGFEILYVLDTTASQSANAIVLQLFTRSKKKNGEWTVYKELRIGQAELASLPDALDSRVIASIIGGAEYYYSEYRYSTAGLRRTLSPVLALQVIPPIAEAGRLAVLQESGSLNFKMLAWDDGDPWRLWLEVRQDDRDQWAITGSLRRGEESMPLTEPAMILESGFLIARGKLARFDPAGGFAWVRQLRRIRRIPFPDRERDQVLSKLLQSPLVPPMDLDEPLRFEQRTAAPRLGLRIGGPRQTWSQSFLETHLLFHYGAGWEIESPSGPGSGMWLPEERVYVHRDLETENAARRTLEELGLRADHDVQPWWRLAHKALPRVVRELMRAGWHVEAEGKAFRTAGETRVDVRSGIDWFELYAEVEYGGATAKLPQLLAALRRGESMVPLDDGSFGLLPEDWLEKFGPLASLGSKETDHLRFRRNQAGLLDALLAAQPHARVDELFERVRDRLRSFAGVQAAPQPEGFVGQLRDYQREGLGWMEFLREFGFGGCLADDMGVGKTAQVLATLETRRTLGKGPSLVVAPKSVIFNWREEAARFTPQLRVLEHTGMLRDAAEIPKHHLVLTTYGTMLRDAAALSEIQFDYVVLDEAQAIKNASTASAKAVRLLKGEHRMALSGTPVENHLGELWSLFEFLNPGMLGEAKVLKMSGGLARNPSPEARALLGQALRPFILRRTKQQVARELPEKTEQTILCELDAPQRKQYDELRAHYRATLLGRVDAKGLARSKMHVLEALLRLRQAACHPGLLDHDRIDEPSAKLETLLAQLAEIREEGHKALVFSQFTSLLAIVRRRLDEQGVRYEYLDGATRDRQSHVDGFQNDPDCGLFLISLKAGGLGLNLTAAEYVFLLDPWWNPAVEAQAVDRAHRIGQTRPVFAYRLIARDTVEEKVLELQKSKRALADAILGEDNSLIRDLKREDLELLLS